MTTFIREIYSPIYAIQGTTVIATDDNLIVTTVSMQVGAYAIASQPLLPSLITVKHTAVSTVDTLGTITIVGTDENDVARTEIITPSNGATVTGAIYFKTITSVTGAGWVVADGADSVIVGVANITRIPVNGRTISFYNVSGNLWINPLATAVADATSFPMIAAGKLDLIVKGNLSVITDGSGGSLKYIIWDV